jgi:predicted glutamine amidotransferase
MCGIVGLLAMNGVNDKQVKALQHLLLLDMMRGAHATGLAKVNLKTGEPKVHKLAVDAIDYLSDKDTKDFLAKDRQGLYIGHNRYATMGTRTDDGAHPFTHKHITMVHNGMVDTHVLHDLDGYRDPDCTVDSEMVCRTIAERGIEEAVKKFSGAFSLVWWDADARTLNFLRNEKRPMFICHTYTTTMWASEKNFLRVLLAREDNFDESFEPYETKPHALYSWHFDNNGKILYKGHAKVRQLTIPEVPAPFQNRWNGYSGYYGTDRTSAAKISSDRRITTKLREMGLTCAYNQRVILEVSQVNRTNMFDTKVDLYGTMYGPEGVSAPFRTFQTPLESLLLDFDIAAVKQLPTGRFSVEELEKMTKGCSRIFATVDNAYTVSERDTADGVYKSFDRVIVNEAKSQPVVARDEERPVEKKPAGNEANVIEGPAKFPLKVDGWTFTSPQEFMNLTSNGCAACGDIPTVFNRNNKHMCVYSGVGNRKATIMDAEFICGNCINNDTKALDKAMSLTLV